MWTGQQPESKMSKQEDFKVQQLQREVAGMKKEITRLHRATQMNTAELGEYKRTNDKRVRDLEIRDAVLTRGIPAKDVAKSYELSRARISQIVTKATV